MNVRDLCAALSIGTLSGAAGAMLGGAPLSLSILGIVGCSGLLWVLR